MVRHLVLACILYGVLIVHPRQASAHGAEMLLGSTASKSGALALSYDFTATVIVTEDVSLGGVTLYTNILPGIEWLQADQPSPPLYVLNVGTPFSIQIVSIDSGASVMVGGSMLNAAGQSAFVANTTNVPGDHFHPQWQLVLPDGVVGAYSLSFKLTTTSSTYAPSETYTLLISNILEATATASPSQPDHTATATPASVTPAGTETATPTPNAALSPTPSSRCPGDCDGNGTVAVNELVTAVAIALGEEPVARCPAADIDHSGQVTVAELVHAVNSALNGCA